MESALAVDLLYSSFTEPPVQGVYGYCFSGSNYVYGTQGSSNFHDETGGVVGSNEDGCYIAIVDHVDFIEFGVDAAGLAKLFYYSQNGIWAVSSSLTRLVDHLRENKIRLTPNFPQLAALGWGLTFTTQMCSFATVFNEVSLAPSACALILRDECLRVKSLTSGAGKRYSENLHEFMSSWVSRFITLFKNTEINVDVDITGGVDSRSVFALVNAAMVEGDIPREQANFRSGTSSRWSKDLAVAKQLTNRYGFVLNSTRRNAQKALPGELVFERWRRVSLGVYLPVYLQSAGLDPYTIHVNGGGGENHRRFYKYDSMEQFINGMRRRMSRASHLEWARDVEAAMATLRDDARIADDFILHYREFRNRFHTGRNPQFIVGFAPMATTLFHMASPAGGLNSSAQLNYDVMENLVPGLKDLPYDASDKSPTTDNTSNLTLVQRDLVIKPGKAYVSASEDSSYSPDVGRLGAFEIFDSQSLEALGDSVVADFLGQEKVEAAKESLEDARANGGFEHASKAKMCSYALSVKYALGR